MRVLPFQKQGRAFATKAGAMLNFFSNCFYSTHLVGNSQAISAINICFLQERRAFSTARADGIMPRQPTGYPKTPQKSFLGMKKAYLFRDMLLIRAFDAAFIF